MKSGQAIFTSMAILCGTAGLLTADDARRGDIFKKLDANADGKLEAAEAGADNRHFQRLIRIGDKDGDGVLTRAEFDAAVGERAERPKPAERKPADRPDRGNFIKRLDQNGDGKITPDEVPEGRKERFEQMLERLGKSKEEGISIEEMQKRIAERGGPQGRPGFGGGRFDMLDENNDGVVTRDEVPERMQRFFDRIADQLGKKEGEGLTKDEIRQAMEKLREQFQKRRGERKAEAK